MKTNRILITPKSQKQAIAIALVITMFGWMNAAHAQMIIIDPVSATASSTYQSNVIAYTIDGSGLSTGVGSLPTGSAIPGSWPTDNNDDPAVGHDAWFSANGTVSDVVVTYNLGAVYTLDGFHLWNYNTAASGTYDRGIQQADIQVSTDGLSWTDLGPSTFAEATGLTSYTGADYALSDTGAQYVKFNIISDYGDPSYVGLSEIRFEGTTVEIPEPSTVALLGLGALGLAFLIRRRRTA